MSTVAGVIRTYTDFMGRTQKAVDGPNGTYLITRDNERSPYVVWKSDSLSTVIRTRNAVTALERACVAAGVEL